MSVTALALELNLFCIAILVLILYRVLRRNDRQVSQLKFRNMLILHILALLVNALGPYVNASMAHPARMVRMQYTTFVFYYVLLNLSIRSWFVYLFYSMNLEERQTAHLLRLVNASTLILALLDATSQLTHVFFYVQGNQLIRTTLMQWQVIYLFATQLLTAAVANFRHRDRHTPAERRRLGLIATYPILPFIFMIFRFAIGSLPYLAVSNTMALLIIYIGYLDQLISVDPLTGVNNRDRLMEHIRGRMEKNATGQVILMFDINRFKRINDTYGHLEGDRALRIVADALRSVFDSTYHGAFLARYGGDEFIVTAQLDEERTQELIDKIRAAVAKAREDKHLPYALELSIGQARYAPSMQTPQAFIEAADQSLYLEKERMHRREGTGNRA